MVGLTKQALYKTIGLTTLTWAEYVDVLLDIELVLNNRPLTYNEDDVEMPMLTPNIMMFGQPNHTPEQDMEEIDDRDLRKRAKHLKKCKDMVWRRWRDEYLRGLRGQHDLRYNGKHNLVAPGDLESWIVS